MESSVYSVRDVDMTGTNDALLQDCEEAYFKIALDFGTTRTSVGFTKYEQEEYPPGRRLNPERDIILIDDYPNAPPNGTQARQEVPSVLWFPPKRTLRSKRTQSDIGMLTPSSDSNEGEIEDEDSGVDEMNATRAERLGDQILWGYGVHKRFADIGIENDDGYVVTNFKLLLGEADTEDKKKIKSELQATFREVQSAYRGELKTEDDLFRIYFERLFEHVYQELVKCGFNDTCHVEPIVCVPAMWKPDACRRMERAVLKAMRKAGIFGPESSSDPPVFIVSEPEAASTLVLEQSRGLIHSQDTFVLLDAGGGTVDAVCYSVNKTNPIRLEREEVKEDARLCGSSYLNLNFRSILRGRLRTEDLSPDAAPMKRVLDHAVETFEYITKRNIDDITKTHTSIRVSGVKKSNDNSRRLDKNTVYLKSSEIRAIFQPCLDGTVELMCSQLTQAKKKGKDVKLVVLIGGFADSKCLRYYLMQHLDSFNSANGTYTKLLPFKTSGSRALACSNSTAIACGALVRASRKKEDGPKRHLQSSYGLLRREYHQPDAFEFHKEAKIYRDALDGKHYVKTIEWPLVKGNTVSRTFSASTRVFHTFSRRQKDLRCEEVLYVSDEICESHCWWKHGSNKSAQKIDTIVVDVTKYKNSGEICLKYPEGKGEGYYEIVLDLILRVNGRNLTVEAIYPPLKDPDNFNDYRQDQVLKKMHHSIAAAFVHGTD